eukprot:CAMPEP_0117026164 /NCGR_PEP_ID=MMETSP0472-20121206/19264_1 /TAXON_ID=693140 ORGANISM="Tiarina fusus, Strain LIS" /NCGR_SAMPLE_ID=MMETSP0472 /ASSEMBLY_ACC=CAM_ASM_000603 /LENGTH=404 /DNA_ID=CAMNT_0004733099 /DNA_START=41 /DNA_END=1255 /DNA_ORIENTATION=+
MSNNNRDNKPRPNYGFGKAMPANPKKNMDEDVEETTRRVGGRGAPAMVAPSMGAMPMPFNLSGAPQSMQMPGFGASINTAPMKGARVGLQTQSRPKFVWSLNVAPTLPDLHRLERTAAFVPNTNASVIAARISNVLRDRSIEAAYDNDKAKVKCVTTEGVDFRVRLYRGKNQYSHGIIVEVQRRFGSSLHFHADTEAILDAAQGKTPMPPPAIRSALPEVSDDEDDDDCDVPPPSGASSLAMIAKMLNFSGFDAQYVGMQMLSPLVDSERMSLQTARAVSTELLNQNSEVGTKIFGYIVNRSTDESVMTLRAMSLQILADSMKASGIVPQFVRAPLRPVLLKDLKDSEAHPRTAMMAARCLEYFIRGDHDTMELNEAFEHAREVGEARHAGLMRQAERCISSIR